MNVIPVRMDRGSMKARPSSAPLASRAWAGRLLFSLLFLLLGCVGRGADGQAGRGGASEPSVSMYLRISLRRKMLVMSRRVLTSVDESCCSVYFASTGSTYLGW